MSKPGLILLTLLALLVVPVGAAAEDASAARKKVRLKAFKSCTGLTSYARANAPRTVGTGMSRGAMPPTTGGPERGGEAPTAAPAPAAGDGAGSAAPDYSTTNVQEEGVDEPDTIKTDGKTLFTTSLRSLHAIDARAADPTIVGTLELPVGSGYQLLLHENRLLVIAQGVEPTEAFGAPAAARAASVPYSNHRATTMLMEIDVTDPRDMKLVRTLEVEGWHVSSRLNGSTVRLVLNTVPRALDFAPTSSDGSVREMRSQVRRSSAGAFVPRALLTHHPTGRTLKRKVVACQSVRHAPAFSGIDMVTVATVDLRKGLHIIDSDGLMTNADIVYGSTKNLYLATQRWLRPGAEPSRLAAQDTLIHKFSLTDAESTTYKASGEVPGYLLSQWAMSEDDGNLRVASTTWPIWMFGEQPQIESQSYVTVLAEDGGRLVRRGQVGGLGKGERIYAVRFIDDIGYVVTFRQIDPLYTVDVSDPTNPRVRGELKIAGYSAYLHPVGKDLLLGVGQDGTEEGQRLGTQLSLFDVSDPADPRRLHQKALTTGSSSAAEYDHHAFLYWPATKLAVIPLFTYGEGTQWAGAYGFRIDRDEGITEVGRAQHEVRDGYAIGIERANVIGDRLFTLSMMGVEVGSLATLAEQAFIPFPLPQGYPQPAAG